MYISVCIASRIQPAAKPAKPPNSSAEPKAARPMASPGRVGSRPWRRWVMVPAKAVGTMAKLLVARA